MRPPPVKYVSLLVALPVLGNAERRSVAGQEVPGLLLGKEAQLSRREGSTIT